MEHIKKIRIKDLSRKHITGIVKSYLWLNKLPLGLLSICIILGTTKMFGQSKLVPWKNWEVSAWGFTFIYTLYIYHQGYKKKYFKAIGGQATALIVASIFILLFIFVISLNEYEYFRFSPYSFTRPGGMLLLFLTTLLFIILDFTMAKALASKQPAVSKTFFLSMKFSDIPISIAFAILTVYAFSLGESEINHSHMDSFFGGTIAFQMMLSNIIWTLTGDVFVEHPHDNRLHENTN